MHRPIALVVVLALALAGCLSLGSGQDAASTARWSSSDCSGASLVWTPSIDDLDPVVGPWQPAEGPVPDRGVFVLFAFECPDTRIDGDATGPVSGGAAIVPVETPNATHGIEADDGWAAIPEHVGDPAVAELFDAHGFTVPDGDASVRIDRSPLGWRVRMTYNTSDGEVAADGGVDPDQTHEEPSGAFVADHDDPFSVFHGPEQRTRRTGGATVQASGDTWVSRLDLEPTPFSYAVDTAFRWDFTFERDASAGDAARTS